ncbi:hypothetical protein DXG03_004957 [Asterophora parasitica]|uniref:Uncharacterized protein n=1 Tax=Asterophora parasitica TaxID=117018 RepID=A0A9P7GE49_9AGAR|nr:hypothetical protein DXG03_004957 [Asterophora parasitica]
MSKKAELRTIFSEAAVTFPENDAASAKHANTPQSRAAAVPELSLAVHSSSLQDNVKDLELVLEPTADASRRLKGQTNMAIYFSVRPNIPTPAPGRT